jgi:hypothetical protein
MIESLDILANVNEDTTLLHKYSDEFLTISEANVKSLSTALKITSKRLFKDIEVELASLKEKCHSNFNKVYLNVVDALTYAFKEACPITTIQSIPVEILTNTVIGLEDYAVNNMLAAAAYTYNHQTTTRDYHTYSIDPFLSQKASNYQFKQNL